MKNIFLSVIKRGGYSLPDMLKRIDQYHVDGKLSDADRDELYDQARAGADPTGNLDLLRKMLELEDRVRKLEQAQAQQPEPDQAPDDYVAGKWYKAGDRVSFEGATYTCTAPDSAVCVWSPAEYPDYWKKD